MGMHCQVPDDLESKGVNVILVNESLSHALEFWGLGYGGYDGFLVTES